jgi:hypothetical protein
MTAGNKPWSSKVESHKTHSNPISREAKVADDKYFLLRIAIFVLSIAGAATAFGSIEEATGNFTVWLISGIALLLTAILVVISDLSSSRKFLMANI